MNKFKERVKELRVEKGLSQRKLAKIFNCTDMAVHGWESGKQPDYDTLIKLAEFFDVTVCYLLGTED